MPTTAKLATIVITATVITSCRVLNPRELMNAVLFMICRRRLSVISMPPAKGGRCYLAMAMPALFKVFLLRFCAGVPRDGNSGVTSGDSEWKRASYKVL